MALLSWQLGSTTAQTATQDFFYDAQGNPYAVKYNGTLYYYITNLQGDVLHITNSSGTTVVSYTYDPYGKPLTTTGSLSSTLGAANPLRYRGYYFDSETGFYYLQSRYYDPSTGRFINADSYASTGQEILGNNMFAYCLNNPVCRKDISGAASVECYDSDGNLLTDDDKRIDGGKMGDSDSNSGQGGSGYASSTALQPYYPPNDGFVGEVQEVTLQPGTLVQRTGGFGGKYIAPAGTPKQMLSLPYGRMGESTTILEVQQPVVVLAGRVAPWFGQIGCGIQYQLSFPLIHYINTDVMRIIA